MKRDFRNRFCTFELYWYCVDKERYQNSHTERENFIEVTEDELGIPVTAHRNVTILLRTGGVFHVDINAAFDVNQVLTPHTQYFEEMPMVYPHEIVIPPIKKEEDRFMHVMHITNVGTDKAWYIKKGDVVAFA